MGIVDGIISGVQSSKQLKSIAGLNAPTFVSGQNRTQQPGTPTHTTQLITPEEMEAMREKVNSGQMTPEENKAWADQLIDNGDGTFSQKVTFEDPNFAGQPPVPSFRDILATTATGAINQQGVRNPLNYQREAPQVQPGLNAMREGQTIDQSGVTMAQLLGIQARGSQGDALEMQRQAALGQQPSVAAIQQQQGLDAALSGQFAMANSARGGAAQRGAAQGVAQQQAGQMQQAAVGQAAALRAAEMAQARGAYGDLAGAMRGGDLGQGQLSGQMALSQAELYQQQQLANQGVIADADSLNARLMLDQNLANQSGILGQQGLDDQRTMGMIGATQNADAMDLDAQKAEADAWLALLGLKTGVATGQQQRGDRMMGGALQTGGQILSFIPGMQGAGRALSSAGG